MSTSIPWDYDAPGCLVELSLRGVGLKHRVVQYHGLYVILVRLKQGRPWVLSRRPSLEEAQASILHHIIAWQLWRWGGFGPRPRECFTWNLPRPPWLP